MPLHEKELLPVGVGGAPEGRWRLDSILLSVLTVLYFPFRQTTPLNVLPRNPVIRQL
jgi:hypothetical protein